MADESLPQGRVALKKYAAILLGSYIAHGALDAPIGGCSVNSMRKKSREAELIPPPGKPFGSESVQRRTRSHLRPM